jgi:hypothetical protein
MMNPIQPLPSSRHSYVSKIAPESSKPLRTQRMHAKQKQDSLKNLEKPERLPQMKPKKQQKLSFSAIPKPPPVIPEEPKAPEEPEEPVQAQRGQEREDESYEELMVDSLVSIVTGHRKLQWKAHKKAIVDKMATQTNALTRLTGSTWGLPLLQARQVYAMVTRPAMSYAAPFP